ncbi:NAD-dependent epimerase/dehydratase family protein [Candidatus Pelagibacter sp.]|nr:NAD-dependent epimerase/dehydratase family protein [Candidatus Pelagibacter sp.]
MKIALITGSSGLVGSESVEFFIKKKFMVIGIDNDFRKFFFGKSASTKWVKSFLEKKYSKNYKHFNSDITKIDEIEKIFKKYKNKIKVVIHSAAQPSHDWAASNPELDFKVNAIGTLNLLNLTKKYLNKRIPFIYMSTNKVYGDNPNKLKMKKKKLRFELANNNNYFNGINETMSIDNCVHSFFGVSKLSADLMVQEFGVNFGMNTVCFRAGCITGSKHSGAKLHGFLSYLVKSCLKEKKYTIIGYEGKQVRDNIHSSDLVNCFWEYYKNPRKGMVYNIGGGRKCSCSIIEAINIIEKNAKIKVKLKVLKKARTGDHIWWITDNKKFMKDYPNFKIKYNIEKVIEELISKI